jgi:uncharacterized protein YndB with AHSA1/START domain
MTELETITIHASINAPVEKVWKLYTKTEHIMNWNNASEDWHTPKAENDLKVGGKFLSRMEAKDGSAGFDFEGTYDEVETNKCIAFSMSDGRKVTINFEGVSKGTRVTITFEAEKTNTIEMQRQGWQAILNNFKRYVEENK